MQLNIRTFAEEWARGTLRDPAQHFRRRITRSCPCCGYEGYFVTKRRREPVDFRCPNCKSRPRDRLIALWMHARGIDMSGTAILHVAPEWPLFNKFKHEPGYVGGDIKHRPHANTRVDITDIGFPDGHFDYLICNHVLEHVADDARGMREAARVLKPGGTAIFSVPLSGQDITWEPPPGMPKIEVERICGRDHQRYYGADFAKKLQTAGFSRVETIQPSKAEKLRHCLIDEPIFIAAKV